MAKKNLVIGGAAVAMILGLGVIGVATVRRDVASAAETHEARTPRPLPLLTTGVPIMDSIDKLKATAAQKPGDPLVWQQLGTANIRATNYDAAVDAYKKAVALAPQDAASWSALGEAYTHAINSSTSKMPALARAAFDKALALDPGNVRARFYIALEKDYAGQHDAAVAGWLGLLQHVPVGSGPDVAIRQAILDSLNRNIRLVSKAVEETRRLQPKLPPVKDSAKT